MGRCRSGRDKVRVSDTLGAPLAASSPCAVSAATAVPVTSMPASVQARVAAARPAVLPHPAGPAITSTGRPEVRIAKATRCCSGRNPAA